MPVSHEIEVKNTGDATKFLNGVGTYTAPTGNLASVNPQTGSYQAVAGDADNVVTMSVAGANTFKVPKDATVNFRIGTTLTVIQISTGQTTLTPEDGTITISTASSLTTRAQYSVVSVIKIASNLWVAGGDLT